MQLLLPFSFAVFTIPKQTVCKLPTRGIAFHTELNLNSDCTFGESGITKAQVMIDKRTHEQISAPQPCLLVQYKSLKLDRNGGKSKKSKTSFVASPIDDYQK